MRLRLFALLFSALTAIAGFGQDAKPADKKEPEKPDPTPANFVRKHTIRINNADFPYTTTAEEIYLKDGDGKSTASFFTIYYTKDGVTNPETRPVTFVFNGGPGSASMFLHLGLVGPRLLDIPSDASDPGAPPYKLRDNPSTILRATDLVFVDPVGTGFSHAMGDKKGEDFWGYDEDADSVAEFIRTFVTHHNRWNSPKYILGESYGGIRTSLLVPRLQGDLNVGLNGTILISPALNMATLPFLPEGNDQMYATSLPAFAATAWYHHRVPNQEQYKDLPSFLKEVEQFASTDYLLALFQGDRVDAATKDRVAEKMHRYIGISKEYIVRADLRVGAFRFAKELMRDQGKTLGMLDGRYIQSELDNISDTPNSDPFSAKTGPIYATVFQTYLRNDLGVDWDKRYIPSNGEANRKWKRPGNRRGAFAGFVDVTDSLAQGTKDNEALRVFAAGGYNDLVTSYFALHYMLDHSGMDPNRVTVKCYDGGHMMYLHRESGEALSNDIVAFIGGAK
jgi:carboxypeptidase C (cathepsin A)